MPPEWECLPSSVSKRLDYLLSSLSLCLRFATLTQFPPTSDFRCFGFACQGSIASLAAIFAPSVDGDYTAPEQDSRAAADDRSRGKSYSSFKRGNAALWAVQSASIAALRAARLQCEFSLGGCKGGVSLFEKEIPLPYPRPPHQVGKNRNLLFQKEPCDIFYCNRSLSNGKHLKHMPHPLADLQAAGNVCALHRLIELF